MDVIFPSFASKRSSSVACDLDSFEHISLALLMNKTDKQERRAEMPLLLLSLSIRAHYSLLLTGKTQENQLLVNMHRKKSHVGEKFLGVKSRMDQRN